MNEEEAVRQFLGERPGAGELAEWRETLETRLRHLEAERERAGGGAAAALNAKIQQLRRQIEALREEEAITQFVEDSVRVTLAMGTVADEV
jgi:hypothetical protein